MSDAYLLCGYLDPELFLGGAMPLRRDLAEAAMQPIAQALAAHHERTPETYEFQMLYGIRPDEQKRIADRGAQMRVYIPFGDEWYGYLMRRMAERPASIAARPSLSWLIWSRASSMKRTMNFLMSMATAQCSPIRALAAGSRAR